MSTSPSSSRLFQHTASSYLKASDASPVIHRTSSSFEKHRGTTSDSNMVDGPAPRRRDSFFKKHFEGGAMFEIMRSDVVPISNVQQPTTPTTGHLVEPLNPRKLDSPLDKRDIRAAALELKTGNNVAKRNLVLVPPTTTSNNHNDDIPYATSEVMSNVDSSTDQGKVGSSPSSLRTIRRQVVHPSECIDDAQKTLSGLWIKRPGTDGRTKTGSKRHFTPPREVTRNINHPEERSSAAAVHNQPEVWKKDVRAGVGRKLIIPPSNLVGPACISTGEEEKERVPHRSEKHYTSPLITKAPFMTHEGEDEKGSRPALDAPQFSGLLGNGPSGRRHMSPQRRSDILEHHGSIHNSQPLTTGRCHTPTRALNVTNLWEHTSQEVGEKVRKMKYMTGPPPFEAESLASVRKNSPTRPCSPNHVRTDIFHMSPQENIRSRSPQSRGKGRFSPMR